MSTVEERQMRRVLDSLVRIMEPQLVFSEDHPDQMTYDQMLILHKITERDRRIRYLLDTAHDALKESRRKDGMKWLK